MSYESLLALFAAYAAVVIVAGIVWYVLQVIAYWRIFTKAGQPGWKSIIPIYNVYTQYKISWSGGMFWVFLILSVAANVVAGMAGEGSTLAIVGTVLMICAVLVSLVSVYKLARSFHHGLPFTLGLLFLSPIFMLILGLGSSRYYGPHK